MSIHIPPVLVYRQFVISSRKVPDRRGSTRTGHTEWSGKTTGPHRAKGYFSRHPLTCGTLVGLKRQIDRRSE